MSSKIKYKTPPPKGGGVGLASKRAGVSILQSNAEYQSVQAMANLIDLDFSQS
jgi:hypothetical protein